MENTNLDSFSLARLRLPSRESLKVWLSLYMLLCFASSILAKLGNMFQNYISNGIGLRSGKKIHSTHNKAVGGTTHNIKPQCGRYSYEAFPRNSNPLVREHMVLFPRRIESCDGHQNSQRRMPT